MKFLLRSRRVGTTLWVGATGGLGGTGGLVGTGGLLNILKQRGGGGTNGGHVLPATGSCDFILLVPNLIKSDSRSDNIVFMS